MDVFFGFFWLLGGILPPFPGFPTKVQGKFDSPHLAGATKHYQRKGHIWSEEEIRGIILEYNLPGHSFVLRDLFPTSFSNKLLIV